MLYLKFMILDCVLRLNLVKKKVFLNLFYMQRALCSTREHSSLLYFTCPIWKNVCRNPFILIKKKKTKYEYQLYISVISLILRIYITELYINITGLTH